MAASAVITNLTAAASYPASVSISLGVQQGFDQGNKPPFTPTPPFPLDVAASLCTAFQFLDPKNPYSRMFLDYTARGYMATQSGSSIKSYMACCINALIQTGFALETDLPYVSASWGASPSSGAFTNALSHRVLSYIAVANITTQLKACISLGAPLPWVVIVTTFVGWTTDSAVMGTQTAGIWSGTGSGLVYQNASDSNAGTMAICVYGWNDLIGTGVWIARSAWGAQGAAGIFYFPYAYITANAVSDIWALQTVSTGPPVACSVGTYAATGSCSTALCGASGVKTMTRTNIAASNGGTPCPDVSTNSYATVCTNSACPPPPQDCVMTLWANPICTPPVGIPATTTCGWTGGTQTLSRSVLTPASGTGVACPSSLTMTLPNSCDGPICTSKDCSVSGWSPYGVCNAPGCGTSGLATSTRAVISAAVGTGAACPLLTQTQACNTSNCPVVDCKVGAWSDWGRCSSTSCGTPGTKTATRSVVTPMSGGGLACPSLTSTKPCDPMCDAQIVALVMGIVGLLIVALVVTLLVW